MYGTIFLLVLVKVMKKNEKKPHPKTQTNIHWKLNSKNVVIAVK